MATSLSGAPLALDFAPQRRGSLNSYEICFADEQRLRGRGWQNIANMLGRHVDDVRRHCEPQKPDTVIAPEPAPLSHYDVYLLCRVEQGRLTPIRCAELMQRSFAEVEGHLAARTGAAA